MDVATGQNMLWAVQVVYLLMAMYLAGLVLLLMKKVKPARYLLSAAVFPALSLLAWYVYAFLSDDFSLEAVYVSSSTGLPALYKLSASWSSAGGSLLLLVAMMGVALLVHEARALYTNDESRVTSLIMSFLIFYFLIAIITANPFSPTGSSPSNGLGLTPSLQSLWALVHPPTVFAAYVVALFAYCSVLSSRLIKGSPRLGDGRLLTASWILLGFGITLGAAWAYETLGWGGYWAWDTVETSALIPWLVLSAVLFARRQGNLNLELFGVTFATCALLLIPYVARGSTVVSPHSYGDIASAGPFILLALFPVFFTVATFLKSPMPGAVATVLTKSEFYISEFWCLTLLAIANLVLLLLELFSGYFGVMFLPSPHLHNYVSFPFVLAFAALLTVESAFRRPRMKYVVILSPMLLAVGVLLWFAKLLTASPYLAVGLPFCLALSIGGTMGVASTLSSRPRRAPVGSTVRYLTVLGIGVMLLGVLFSASMRTSVSEDLAVGETISVGGTTLTVQSISTSPSAGTVDMPGHGIVPEMIDTEVTYSVNTKAGTSSTLLEYFPVPDEFFPVPSVYSSLVQDVYVVANATASVNQASAQVFKNGGSASPAVVGITMQTIPGVSLIWIGTGLLLFVNLFFVMRRAPYVEPGPDSDQQSASSMAPNVIASSRQ